VLQLNMGIYKLKFSMNFLMNLCSHLQVVAALLIGGWLVHTDQLQVGGVVAFISAVGRLNDPWGDLVNYFRELSVTQLKFRLLADIMNQLSERRLTTPIDGHQAIPVRGWAGARKAQIDLDKRAGMADPSTSEPGKAAIGMARVARFSGVKRTLRRSLPASLLPPVTTRAVDE